MPLFSKKKDVGVSSLVLKIVNNNCPELRDLMEGPRLDSRVNLLVVVMILPLEKKKLSVDKVFMAVTKEFSNTGVAVVTDSPRALDQVILGFRFEGSMYYVLAKAKHLNPLGGGFYQIGFQMLEVVAPADYPGLSKMTF